MSDIVVNNYFVPVISPITFNVYNIMVQQWGDGKNYKILFSNGGPGMGFEYLIPPFKLLIKYGFTLYFYYQLGVGKSDNPPIYYKQGYKDKVSNPDYSMDYYASELEQIRKYLNMEGPKNYIFGHSFGGMIIFQWAKNYPHSVNLLNYLNSGLIISSGISCISRYVEYSNQLLSHLPSNIKEVLYNPQHPLFKEYSNKYYNDIHILKIKPRPLLIKEIISEAKENKELYNYLQGPSEFIISGSINNFDLRYILPYINIRTLIIGGKLDSVDPKLLNEDALMMPKGEFYLTNGSHNSFYDDTKNYLNRLLEFLFMNDINKPLSSDKLIKNDDVEEMFNSPFISQGKTYLQKLTSLF